MMSFTPLLIATPILIIAIVIILMMGRGSIDKNNSFELISLIKEGITAYFKRLLSSVIQLLFYLSILLFLFSRTFKTPFYWDQIISFSFGGIICIAVLFVTTRSKINLIAQITKQSKVYYNKGLLSLFSATQASGLIIISLILISSFMCFELLGALSLIGFGLGLTLTSFILRIGGSLYKTSTNIATDTLSHIEKKIPSFDKRNPGTILDISGDFIGNIIGVNADLIGSFSFALISSVLMLTTMTQEKTILLIPFHILSLGLLSSCLSFIIIRTLIKKNITHNSLLHNIYTAILISGIGVYLIINTSQLPESINLFYAYLTGLVSAIIIAFSSEYLTSTRFSPTKNLAKQSEFGSPIIFINALKTAMQGNFLYLITILGTILLSFHFAKVLGITLAVLGALSITASISATSSFSCLAANILKIITLGDEHESIIKNSKKMDRLGQTSLALGNGFNAGSAILSTFSLFFVLFLLSKLSLQNALLIDISLLSGLVIGAILPFIFSGFLLQGLLSCIHVVIKEISRQFREIPYLYENKAKPDIIKASDHNTYTVMNLLIIPGIIMIVIPTTMGFLFGPKLLLGLILGILLTSLGQSFFYCNVGDSLHHAKTYIKTGHFGGKESPTYTHIAITDNIGDAYKDLLGPSLNILIKTVTILSLLIIIFLNR